MEQNLVRGGYTYGETTIAGKATAVLGNYNGMHIENATFLMSTTPISRDGSRYKVVRHNRVYPSHTIETITTYDDGVDAFRRGTSRTMELHWVRCEDLGEGVFGEVHREESCDASGICKSRAVKVLRLRQLRRLKVDYRKEIGALVQLSQPAYAHRFVEFFSWYEDTGRVFLSMEYIQFGDLTNYMDAALRENDAKQIAYQVLDGIRVMHLLDIIHRDIKPGNIFVVRRGPNWWVKIGDFSLCKNTITQNTTLQTMVGTSGYQAPEVIGFVAAAKSRCYDAKCDVWSFGCLVYEMLTGQLPFPEPHNLASHCRNPQALEMPSLTSPGTLYCPDIQPFVRHLLQPDPKIRPTTEEAIAFGTPWFRSVLDNEQQDHPVIRCDKSGDRRLLCEDERQASLPAASDVRHIKNHQPLANTEQIQDFHATNTAFPPAEGNCAVENHSNASSEFDQTFSDTYMHDTITATSDQSFLNSGALAEETDFEESDCSLEEDSICSDFSERESAITFTDFIGRTFEVSIDDFITWPTMKGFISRRFACYPALDSLVQQDKCYFMSGKKTIKDWERDVRTGMHVTMHLKEEPRKPKRKSNWLPILPAITDVDVGGILLDSSNISITLVDAKKQIHFIPWAVSRCWESTEAFIHQAFMLDDDVVLPVMRGHFDLTDSDGYTMQVEHWEDIIVPGMQIFMKIWPTRSVLETNSRFNIEIANYVRTREFCRVRSGIRFKLISSSSADVDTPAIQFEDIAGRKYRIPWTRCRRWEDMEALFQSIYAEFGVFLDSVRDDTFPNHWRVYWGHIKPWEELARPGMNFISEMFRSTKFQHSDATSRAPNGIGPNHNT